MRIARAFPVFSAAFAVLYAICMYNNIALVSYFPRTREWYWLTVTTLPPRAGPGMYWYGWLAVSAMGAAAVAALALLLPARATERVSSVASWAVPAAGILFFIVILRGWFIH
jgi:hypothetical protein